MNEMMKDIKKKFEWDFFFYPQISGDDVKELCEKHNSFLVLNYMVQHTRRVVCPGLILFEFVG